MDIDKLPKVALVYDFDSTLSIKNMMEYAFIPSLGMTAEDFWNDVRELMDREGMDGILAYMYKMQEYLQKLHHSTSREALMSMGKTIQFFPGVEEWFEQINTFGQEHGIQVEHYIISSGVQEIIEGSVIAPYFKRIYACEFMYNSAGEMCWPKTAVNYTGKTQFIFRINKGILDITAESGREINKYTPDNERRIPFENIIYIGDGLTDVPCMKLVKSHGGQSIGLYSDDASLEMVTDLLANERVNCIAPADYRPNSQLSNIIQAMLLKVVAVEQILSLAHAE